VDVQLIAATAASGYAVQEIDTGLNRPDRSGYAPCLRVGELIFVAGQLARDASGKLAVQGTGAETDYIVHRRLVPALEAAQSALDLVLKAQVYLSRPQQLSSFTQTWKQLFQNRLPPTTVIAVRHPAFLTSDATIEINLIAAHRSARARVRDVKCDVGARVLDGLLFVGGLTGSNVLDQAKRIFAAAGTDLSNVARALFFHSDLRELRDPGIPFTAVQADGGLVADLWGYVPGT
jgi:enamine deaminase RidA (YjgF/YER057c/UK114 family)